MFHLYTGVFIIQLIPEYGFKSYYEANKKEVENFYRLKLYLFMSETLSELLNFFTLAYG